MDQEDQMFQAQVQIPPQNQEMALQIVMKCKSLCWKAFIH